MASPIASTPKPSVAARPGAPAVDDIAEEDPLEQTPTAHEPVPGKVARAETGTTSSGGESSSSSASDRPQRMPSFATQATVPDDYARSSPGAGEGEGEGAADDPVTPPKPSLMKRLGLDPITLKLMFKGSLVTTIALSMFQSNPVAKTYSTLGYLIPIICCMTPVVMPRGKFLMTFVLNVLSTSVACAFSLLVLWSSVKARDHTSGPLTAEQIQVYKTTGVPPYNSSQSAVLAIWLMFGVWLVNMVRSKLPIFTLPSIVFSIVLDISCTFGPHFVTMTVCMNFIRRLYTAMLTAFGLSAAVSLFIFPLSSRRILMLQTTGAIGLLRKAVALQGEYLRGLESEDLYALATVETAIGNLGPAEEEERQRQKERYRYFKRSKKAPPPPPLLTREAKAAQALRTTIGAIHELAGKMQQEVVFAKRDSAFGKLTAHDLGEIVKLLRSIIVPVTGMSTIMDIFRRTAEKRGWNNADETDSEVAATKAKERRVWNEIMKQLHEPFLLLSEAIDQGLQHAAIQLALVPQPKEQKAKAEEQRKERLAKKNANGSRDAAAATAGGPAIAPAGGDVEARGDLLQPGDEGFAECIEEKVRAFYKTRGEILRIWARERGLMDGPTLSQATSPSGLDPLFIAREQRQSQLHVLLYMEQLMVATGEAVRDFVEFADSKVLDGTMDKTRFLFPTLRRLRKSALAIFDERDQANEDPAKVGKPDFSVVFSGDGFTEKKDPEHLPAATAWQRFGNKVRGVSRFLGSSESAFGLRVACATMTVAIVCYLEKTQTFFQEQRLVWAMIMISISMTQTSGQSIFGFFCRVFGSFLAMVFAFIIWYIVDGKTAGVLVFMWLFAFVDYYFLIKYPRFISAVMVMIVTQVLIIGYELQVRKIGIKLSESSGQRYYPTYELAPYRLATVSAGCFIAFLWTIFPQPVTDRAWLRRDLSATLFTIGTYFSVVNETLRSEMNQTGGDPTVPGTPAHRLAKVRQALFSKLMTMLPSLQMHAAWQKWEPTIGGAFPRAAYDDIILRTGRMLNYLTLISYTVAWRPRHIEREKDAVWLQSLKDLLKSIGPTHYTILSTLSLLSNSLLSGQPLPPYIPLPRPYELTRQLLTLRRPAAPGEGSGENKDKGNSGSSSDAVKRRNSVADPSPGIRRRNSLWNRPTWKQNKDGSKDGASDAGAGGGGGERGGAGGLYELTNEEDAVLGGSLPIQRQRTAASGVSYVPDWRDVMETGVNTATGDATLMRVSTRTSAPVVAKQGSSVLDASNIEKHGYTEFAMLQVCSTLVCDDLEGLIQTVSGLVGVVDFSFIVDHGGKDVAEKGKGKKE